MTDDITFTKLAMILTFFVLAAAIACGITLNNLKFIMSMRYQVKWKKKLKIG